ncbi:MAG: DUF1835 domain-containing protein [Saprospiraceae bacterium]
MAIIHILNGDCLADQFRMYHIEGNFIVCREALIAGDVKAADLLEFWELRANYLSKEYGVSPEEYNFKVIQEFEKLKEIPEGSEVCLWFENDLFCQVNMWFCIFLLSNRPDINVNRIFPVISEDRDKWSGFSEADAKLIEQALDKKVKFSNEDLELGRTLWLSYQENDIVLFSELSNSPSPCFQYLQDVCQAHMDRFPSGDNSGRPEKVVGEIMASGVFNFSDVFREFSKREGIYGFGDLQLLSIYYKFANN